MPVPYINRVYTKTEKNKSYFFLLRAIFQTSLLECGYSDLIPVLTNGRGAFFQTGNFVSEEKSRLKTIVPPVGCRAKVEEIVGGGG